MRNHGGIPSRHDKYVTLAAISPPGVARGRFIGGDQSSLAGCKSPPLFKHGASSCSSQRQRQREAWGASPQPSAPTYLPTSATSVKFPLCILFLCLNGLSILWINLLRCLFLLHFRYTKISMTNKTRPRLQDEQKWDQ